MLEKKGAITSYYDPYVPKLPITRDHADLGGRARIEWKDEIISSFDVVVICTDHDSIDYQEIVNLSKLIIDTRNSTANIPDVEDKEVKA